METPVPLPDPGAAPQTPSIPLETVAAYTAPENLKAVNPLVRVGRKLGSLARNAWEGLQTGVGMAQSGIRPTFGEATPAQTPEAAAAPAAESRWSKLARRLDTGANILKAATAVAFIGGVALTKVMAARHGIETGTGGGAAATMQHVAETTTMAEGSTREERQKAGLIAGGILVGGLVAGTSGYVIARNWLHGARERRDTLVSQTHQRRRTPAPTPRHPDRTIPGRPSPDNVIAMRAAAANNRMMARWANRRGGIPVEYSGNARPPGHIDDGLRRYRPAARVPGVRPPAPTRLWNYLFKRRSPR